MTVISVIVATPQSKLSVLPQLSLQYWPCNGPIPATVTARYRTPVSARYVLHTFFCTGLIQFYVIGPVPIRYRADTMLTVMAQYWPGIVYTVSTRYQFSTGPIQGRYNECNGPVLARYSLCGIGLVPLQYRADTGPIPFRL